MPPKVDKQNKPSPKAMKALQQYFQLKQRLHNYFFKQTPLKINNNETVSAYTAVYLLLNDSTAKLQQTKKYQSFQQTYLRQYKQDLIEFCGKTVQLFSSVKMMGPVEALDYMLQCVYNYVRYGRGHSQVYALDLQDFHDHRKKLTFRQRDKPVSRRPKHPQKLHHRPPHRLPPGHLSKMSLTLQIQSQRYFSPPNPGNFSIQPLQQMIKIIGVCGFRKFRNVKLEKVEQHYQLVSRNTETNQIQEVGYETQYFKKNFTNRLIKYLRESYAGISEQMIQLSTPEYVNKALGYLEIEELTADTFYPNKQVKSLVIRSIEQVIAHLRAQQLLSNTKTGLFSILDQNAIEDAKNLHILIKRSSNFRLFIKYYQAYIEEKGNTLTEKINAEDERIVKKQLVSSIINEFYELHQRIDEISIKIGKSDVEIIKAQNYAFQVAVNKNEKICNFLAYYADNILRKEQDSLGNMNDLFNKISKLSKYLYSYDGFLKMYQRLLGFRMLYDNFKNKEAEFAILNILKNQAGVSSLNKISCMVADYKFSQNFNAEKHVNELCGKGFNFYVMILTSGSWQVQDPKNGKAVVPPQLMSTVQKFQEIYSQHFPNRSLTWVFNCGRAIVQAIFSEGKKYVLIINCYQLQILLYMQRQGFKGVILGELLAKLKIDDQPAFNGSLMMLVKTGILIKEGNQHKIEAKSEQFKFNMGFKHKNSKISCFQVNRYSEKQSENISKELSLQRSYLVDAAIVKMMKSRRVMTYTDLIAQVQKMCKTFKCDIGFIKKRIENCQNRDFLQRDPNDMQTLIYKP